MNSGRFCRRLAASAFVSAFAVLLSPVLPSQQPYRVVGRWTHGGEGSWDYLVFDAPAKRLYVAHSARVEVLDTQSGKVLGAVVTLPVIFR